MWIKIGRFYTCFVRSIVLNCPDILNLILLCSFNQSYGYFCSGELCGPWASCFHVGIEWRLRNQSQGLSNFWQQQDIGFR